MDKQFGGSGITKEVFDWITDNISVGKVIVELGAGDVSTKYLSERYELYSVEDVPKFCGKWASTYIHAPLVDGWYDINILKEGLPERFSLLLIDGPVKFSDFRPGVGDRLKILDHLDLFDKDAIIIVDDTNRPAERNLLDALAQKTGKKKTVFSSFGVLQ